jgi:hypothetical protein
MVSFKVKLSGSETTYDIDDVDENLFVGEVKGTVEVLVGVPKESQKWIYKGRICKRTSSYFGIKRAHSNFSSARSYGRNFFVNRFCF